MYSDHLLTVNGDDKKQSCCFTLQQQQGRYMKAEAVLKSLPDPYDNEEG